MGNIAGGEMFRTAILRRGNGKDAFERALLSDQQRVEGRRKEELLLAGDRNITKATQIKEILDLNQYLRYPAVGSRRASTKKKQ